MAGTLYDIGVVTPIANIAAALTDKYGVYNDPANLNGYREHDSSAEYLLFECAAIAGNRFIRLRWTSTTLQHQWGTARSGANTLTSPIDFGGTYTTVSAFTHIQLVLHDDTYFLCSDGGAASRMGTRSVIIGKLSNNEYGCYGSGYPVTAAWDFATFTCYNMTTAVRCLPMDILSFNFRSAANEIYKQNIVLMTYDTFQPILNGAALVWFNNVLNIGHNATLRSYILGTNFLIGQGWQGMGLPDISSGSSHSTLGFSALYAEYTPAP